MTRNLFVIDTGIREADIVPIRFGIDMASVLDITLIVHGTGMDDVFG